MMLEEQSKYSDFDNDRCTESTAGEEEVFIRKSEQRSFRRCSWVEATLVVLLTFSIVLNLLTLHTGKVPDLDETCASHTSAYPSPIQKDLKIKYSTIQYQGTFSNPNSSAYRLPPGPEVDAAWLSLGTHNNHYIIPENEAAKYGINPGAAKLTLALGGGFPVLFEFEHHLHCLNLLRQSSHWNYAYYAAQGEGVFAQSEYRQAEHVNHCLDILRQVLMCQPDTGVFGQYWIESIGKTFVDFNTRHKCKNFWELKDWVVAHQADRMGYGKLEIIQREGDVILKDIP